MTKQMPKSGDKGSSAREGTPLSPPLDNSYLMKRIIPNYCDFCTIGIGKSMLFYENAWRQYTHMHQEVHFLRYKNNKYKLCGQCFKRAMEAEEENRLDEFIKNREEV